MNSVDYTPVILAQITDLQMRITKQDATITALKAEVERLTGRSINTNIESVVKTSIPLSNITNMANGNNRRSPQSPTYQVNHHNSYQNNSQHYSAQQANNNDRPRRTRPQIAPSSNEKKERPTMNLSDILKSGEEVTIKIRLPSESGETTPVFTKAMATFDGTDLTVNSCELASSLVGFKTSKPGEILYKFMDELKNGGHIKRTFTIAPWRLCSVERDGATKTLEELRSA
jgi:hypothetical protein